MTQEDLGKRFNKSPQSMSQHRDNNTFNLGLLVTAFPELDLNWMLRGQDPLEAARLTMLRKGLRMILEPLPAPPGAPSPLGEGPKSP